MEEKNQAKTVAMGKAGNEEEHKQLTYEKLIDACDKLFQQNKQLVARNRELEQFALNKRMDFLFKVLEHSNNFSRDFVVSCSKEIEEAMTIPQEETKKE